MVTLLLLLTNSSNATKFVFSLHLLSFFHFCFSFLIFDLLRPRRFYVIGDMTNLYSFIQGSLKWTFSEVFSSVVSLWNQYKYIAFNIFSCRLLIISYKMLTITGIFNETTNKLTIYLILCRNVTIFYRQELAFLFQVHEKLKVCRNWKWSFPSSSFIADDSHVKFIVKLQKLVLSKRDILNFWENIYSLNYYPVKVPQKYFNSFSYSNQKGMRASNFSFALGK